MPKLSDVGYQSVTLKPITQCLTHGCSLNQARNDMTAMDAKRHALEHPGHRVKRQMITIAQYRLEG